LQEQGFLAEDKITEVPIKAGFYSSYSKAFPLINALNDFDETGGYL